MATVLKAVVCGLEESIKASNFNGMASIFMLLEIAYTHVFIRDLTTTRKAAPNASSATAELLKEQSLKKVEGVFDSATKGLNQSLNFILSGEGAFSNMAVPPNSPNPSAAKSNQQTPQRSPSWLSSLPGGGGHSAPESPKGTAHVPAGVYTYPSAEGNSNSISGDNRSGGGGGAGNNSFKPPYADPFAGSSITNPSNLSSVSFIG